MGERNVVVTGGSPWGMRLTGGKDFGSPLMVSKVSRQVVCDVVEYGTSCGLKHCAVSFWHCTGCACRT